MRPPPRRCCASTNPSPGAPIMWSSGHPAVAEEQLGVVAGTPELDVGVRHRPDVAHDLHARRPGRHDQDRRVLVRATLGVGLGEHEHDVGDRRVGDEPLVPVDHPLVAVAGRGGADDGRVGTGEERLGERERARDLTAEVRPEPPFLLRVGRAVREQLHVAAVGSLHPEDRHRHHAATDDLRHQRELQLPEAGAAELRVEERAPEPARLHLLLQVGLHRRPLLAA